MNKRTDRKTIRISTDKFDPNLMEMLRQVAAARGISVNRLCREIVEGVAANDFRTLKD